MIRGVLRPVSRAVIHSRRRGVLRALAAIAGLSGLAGCAPMAAALGGLVIPRHGHHVERGLAYGDEARQRLDVYRPAAATPAATLPAKVIVYFYGGSWRSGERGYYRFVGEAFASRGFVVVVPDYRLYPDVRFPAFVEDGAQAVRWVYDHIAGFGGCGQRVFLMGHSAGAHTAALRAHGGCAESVILADAGHIDLVLALGHPFRRQGGIRDRIAAFIDRL